MYIVNIARNVPVSCSLSLRSESPQNQSTSSLQYLLPDIEKTKEDETNILTTPLSMFAWEPHNDLCELCLLVGGESRGGRPKSKKGETKG